MECYSAIVHILCDLYLHQYMRYKSVNDCKAVESSGKILIYEKIMESHSAIIDPISDLHQYLDCKLVEVCKVVVTLRKYSIIVENRAHEDTKVFSWLCRLLCLICFDFISFSVLFSQPFTSLSEWNFLEQNLKLNAIKQIIKSDIQNVSTLIWSIYIIVHNFINFKSVRTEKNLSLFLESVDALQQ